MSDVLIVDDEPDMLEVMVQIFERTGVQVYGAGSAEEGLQLALGRLSKNQSFDLIIMDIRMPRIDGNEVARQIKEAGYTGKILAFTAAVTMTGRRESQAAGIDRYFGKEVLRVELAEAIVKEYCADG